MKPSTLIRPLALALLCGHSACVAPHPRTPAEAFVPLAGAAPGWQASLLLDDAPYGIWRLEPLPIFPQYARTQVVALDDQGTCWVLISYSGKWTPLRVLHDGAWLGALAHADVDPRVNGPELYVGGDKGILYQVRSYHDGMLDARRIAAFPGYAIHTLIAGQLDPNHARPQILVFTSPGALFRVLPSALGEFQVEKVTDLPGRIRDARLLDDGRTIVTAGRDGRIALLRVGKDGPVWQTIHQMDIGCGRIAVGKKKSAGYPILYSCGDNGRIFRHQAQADGSWQTSVIYHGPRGPRGLAAGQFLADPNIETLAIFGYSGRVELLSLVDGSWNSTTIFTDRDRGHWLSTLEVDGRNNTDELILSGYGARVVLLDRNPGTGKSELAVSSADDRRAKR